MKRDTSRLEVTLRRLARADAPPMSPALDALVRASHPVLTRAPARGLLATVSLSLIVAALHAYANGLRADIAHVPLRWLIVVGLGWALAFVLTLAAAMLPPARRILVDPRRAVFASFAVIVGMEVFGATLGGSASPPPPTATELFHRTLGCLLSGIELAAIPFTIAALFLRNALPIRVRAIGAALGAGGGALGGLALHFQCELGGSVHTGFGHGGAVAVGALLGSWLLPRLRGA